MCKLQDHSHSLLHSRKIAIWYSTTVQTSEGGTNTCFMHIVHTYRGELVFAAPESCVRELDLMNRYAF